MAKDSQPDNKLARKQKCDFKIPITEEGHNKNKNRKRHSINNNDV